MEANQINKDIEVIEAKRPKAVKNKIVKAFLIAFGSLMVALGILGVFLPLMPATVFFLLASACFIRSSDKMYNWLIEHRIFGKYIKNYLQKKGATVNTKIISISLLWLSITYSALFAASEMLWLQILLFAIAIGVTIHLLSINTIKE